MLQFFRNFFKSKIGIPVTLLFLALIAFAFASSDVANTTMFGGVSGGDRVAVVGDTKISTSELSTNANTALDQARQSDPTMTMAGLIERDGLEEVLDQMLQRAAIAEFARDHGFRAGDRLVDSEILQIGAFRGADGSFNRDAFLGVLRQRGLSEAMVRADFETGLLARQVISPASYGTNLPRKLAVQYSKLLRESRKGSIATIDSARFAPTGDPTAEQLQAYYSENSASYIRPERRVIRYATFGEAALGERPAPTEEQIAARFERDAAQYRAVENRSFTQLVAPTEAAAKAIVAEVQGGTSLDASARSKGLATTQIGPVTKQELSGRASAPVADAAFAAGQGAMAAPARGSLGWYVLRVDNVDSRAARTLDQVRGEISTALVAEQRREAFLDMAARVEEEIDGGQSLTDLATELRLEVQATKPVTAAGRIYGETAMVPDVLSRALKPAFEMEEEEPQLAEVVPGETFLLFEVTDITPSATAPMNEIRDELVADWKRSEGSKAARAAADRVMKRLRDGETMAQALSAEEKPLSPAESVDLSRQELARQQQVPPVLALLFSMSEGTVKRLEGPQDAGWFVVQLDEISTPEIDQDDPLIATTMAQLGQVAGDEYTQQFVAAISDEVGVERNQAAIDGLKTQLLGSQQ